MMMLFSVPALAAPSHGTASYYGKQHQGRLTANGERFNPMLLTAAHRTFPFGTVLKVTNLSTKQSVRVIVNDRGPFVKGRIIDLSARAAGMIGMTKSGVAKVRIETL